MRVTMQAGKVVSPMEDARIVSSPAQPASQTRKRQQSNDATKIQAPVLGSSMDGISSGSPDNTQSKMARADSFTEDAAPSTSRVAGSDKTKADCPGQHGFRPYTVPATGALSCTLCRGAGKSTTLYPGTLFLGCKKCLVTICVECYKRPPTGMVSTTPTSPMANLSVFGSPSVGAAFSSFFEVGQGTGLPRASSSSVGNLERKEGTSAKDKWGFLSPHFNFGSAHEAQVHTKKLSLFLLDLV